LRLFTSLMLILFLNSVQLIAQNAPPHSTLSIEGAVDRPILNAWHTERSLPEIPDSLVVDTTDCEVAVLTWSDSSDAESIILLRDGASFDTIEDGIRTYADSADEGSHDWSLIAVNAEGLSDTTDEVSGTIASCGIDYGDSAAGCWYMNGPTSGAETDRSGNGNDLTSTGTGTSNWRSTAVPASYTGRSRLFKNSHLEKDVEGGSLDIYGENAQISITAWINILTVPSSGVEKVIVSKHNTSGNQRQYRLLLTGTGNSQFKFKGSISSNGTTYTEVQSANTAYADSTWYHVAFVDNDADLRIYVDGELSCTPAVYTSGIYDGNGIFSIGKQGASGSTFKGNIDEVGVFSKALSEADVQNIYTYGLTDNGASDFPLYTSFCSTDGVVPYEADMYSYLEDALDALCNDNPSWDCVTFGQSAQGRDIRGIVIAPDDYTKTIVLDAGIHGSSEELATVGTLNLMKYLSENPYPYIRWVIAPLLNPDGVIRGYRKNNNTPAGRLVDLNRNFPIGWGIPDEDAFVYVSTDPNAWNYIGPYPESEPEVFVLEGIIQDYDPDMYVSQHRNSNSVIVPDSSNVEDARTANPYLLANGFEPYNDIRVVGGTGATESWAYSVGVDKSYIYEYGTADNVEEINRSIAWFKNMADSLQTIPVVGDEDVIGLTISVVGEDVVLRWDDDTNPYYYIYSKDTPNGIFTHEEGSTALNEFTIIGGAASEIRFYYIVGSVTP
jgi:hypothetical protein